MVDNRLGVSCNKPFVLHYTRPRRLRAGSYIELYHFVFIVIINRLSKNVTALCLDVQCQLGVGEGTGPCVNAVYIIEQIYFNGGVHTANGDVRQRTTDAIIIEMRS
jgi:hypothetical protein